MRSCKFAIRLGCSGERLTNIYTASIMPGGTPHAVCSPQDTLAIGGYFCLRMWEIIRGLLRDEEHPELTNYEVPEDIFRILSNFLDCVLNNQLAVDDIELNIIWLELQ